MMLSAIACESQKIVFAAVHDSYWTHACDIDRMSKTLRECFIRLHSQDIMGRLREELLARFSENRLAEEIVLKPEDLEKVKEIAKRVGITTRFNKRSKSITVYSPFTLPPLPKKGSFDIKQVAKSTYFFH
jgi:DNA-directed RNA polymerase